MKKIQISVKTLLVTTALFGATSITTAQNVGINAAGAAPDVSAALDVSATDKGLLIPRVVLTGTTDIATIPTPATSLLVYNSATVSDVTPGYYYFDGTIWQRMVSGSIVGTDDQNITGSGLSGTTLTIGIEGGTNETVDLSSLQDGTGTDSQTLSLSGSTLSISGGNNVTLTDNINDADADATNELNTGVSLSGTTLSVTDAGGSQTADLAALKDHDWYEVGGTTQPDAITDDMFTQGSVGIGVVSPIGNLHLASIDAGQNSLGDGAALVIGDISAAHLEIDNNEIVAMNANADSGFLYISAKEIGINSYPTGGTASVRRITLKENGNLGLGTTSPTEKLEIAGSVKIVDGTEGAGKVLTSDASGKASWQLPSTSLLLNVSYPNGQAAVPNTTFSAASGTQTLASFTAPSNGLYMICAITTATIAGGNFADNSSFSANAQTYVTLSGGGSSAAEEHLSEDATKQISISYLFNHTTGDVVNFKVGQQNATSFGYSNLEMRVVKF